MNSYIASDYTEGQFGRIWRTLVFAAGFAAAVGASPATVSAAGPSLLSSASTTADIAHAAHSTSPTIFMHEQRLQLSLREVVFEAEAAKRLCNSFRHEMLSEFSAYLAALDVACKPEITSVEDAERFGRGLRAARMTFEAAASSATVWSKIVSCIDRNPSGGRVVPHRFVVVSPPEPIEELDLAEMFTKVTLRKAAAGLVGDDDADPVIL